MPRTALTPGCASSAAYLECPEPRKDNWKRGSDETNSGVTPPTMKGSEASTSGIGGPAASSRKPATEEPRAKVAKYSYAQAAKEEGTYTVMHSIAPLMERPLTRRTSGISRRSSLTSCSRSRRRREL